MITEIGAFPFQIVHAGVFLFEGIHFLTLADSYSRFAFVYPLGARTAEQVLIGLGQFTETMRRPEKIVFEHCTELKTEKLISYTSRLKTEAHFLGSRSSGIAEKVQDTLMDNVRRLSTVERALPALASVRRAMILYNNSVHEATGRTPMEAVFGGRYRIRRNSMTGDFFTETVLN